MPVGAVKVHLYIVQNVICRSFKIYMAYPCFFFTITCFLCGQVHYTFIKGNLKLQMPPSYSLVIQVMLGLATLLFLLGCACMCVLCDNLVILIFWYLMGNGRKLGLRDAILRTESKGILLCLVTVSFKT